MYFILVCINIGSESETTNKVQMNNSSRQCFQHSVTVLITNLGILRLLGFIF